MKILNFGSLNMDRVYTVDQFVTAGQTKTAGSFHIFPGGKGLNQSVAISRAGGEVCHAGAIGADGTCLRTLLQETGCDVSRLLTLPEPTGHAVIQVNPAGQNCILVCGGANRAITEAQAARMLTGFGPEDTLLVQNETSCLSFAIGRAKAQGMTVACNASPLDETVLRAPLDLVDWFLVNEEEGQALAGTTRQDPEAVLEALSRRFSRANIVLTLGARGALCRFRGRTYRQPACSVIPTDTTGAGDTFCGYFLAHLPAGVETALYRATLAAGLAVTRRGAAASIPTQDEVDAFGTRLRAQGRLPARGSL